MKRCNQCWRVLPLERFKRADGRVLQDCSRCRENRGRGVLDHRKVLRSGCHEPRVLWRRRSKNRKTGPIPVSTTSPETCPPSCRFFNAGCYGESAPMRRDWRRAVAGLSWSEFCACVERLPEGQLWRHNAMGDLPGVGEAIDARALGQLVRANRGRRGFTFTHKEPEDAILRWSNQLGFTINRSADNLEEADEFSALGYPVAVVLPHNARARRLLTPGGRTVTVCPATLGGKTCATCGLCAAAKRKTIVGFPAHGIRKRLVSELVSWRMPNCAVDLKEVAR